MITHQLLKSGDDSLNGIAVIGQTIFVENWLWRPFCSKFLKINTSQAYATFNPYKTFGDDIFFQILLKINTSQAYATLYPHDKFGDNIFITFPLIDRMSSKFRVSGKLAVAGTLCFR